MGSISANTHRLDRSSALTLKSWETPSGKTEKELKADVVVNCGWGRLFFAHTFRTREKLVSQLKREQAGRRDLAYYVRDPHVLVSLAPQDLFIDPSHSYRLWLEKYRPNPDAPKTILVRRIREKSDIDAINRIYASHSMVPVEKEYVWKKKNSRTSIWLVVEEVNSGEVRGACLGVDHVAAFDDPENGSSLWSLAIDPLCPLPGLGEALVRYLSEYLIARSRASLDLSVMHDNKSAIALYEKLGFERVPVFSVKRKNPINETLYSTPSLEAELNPYASIIVDEARRRGVRVAVEDVERSCFKLSFGGRSIRCRESLTELTSAYALSVCDDKALTRRMLMRAGLNVTAQRSSGSNEENDAFLKLHDRIVVKPLRGEQGAGISVDIRKSANLQAAVKRAKAVCDDVILERYEEGDDLRIVVINDQAVACAVRRPAEVIGDGQHTVRDLIKKQSRRRSAATGGESRIPIDSETKRCVQAAGLDLDSVLGRGKTLRVRRTANLHTGGTIHDVTAATSDYLKDAARKAARAIGLPVAGVDMIVPDLSGNDYVLVEVNERPGLANHEPQPTAERFLDMLFPETATQAARIFSTPAEQEIP